MEVRYADGKVEKLATDKKHATRTLGAKYAEYLGRRIKQLEAAETLADVFPPAPGKWHWLLYDRAGQVSGTVKDGIRLIVIPEDGEKEPPLDATVVTIEEVSEHYTKGR